MNVTLSIDIFDINGIAFFHSVSWKLQFKTAEHIATENKQTLMECLNKIRKIYSARGFYIKYVCGDQQFKCLEESFRDIQFSISALGEHVLEVE